MLTATGSTTIARGLTTKQGGINGAEGGRYSSGSVKKHSGAGFHNQLSEVSEFKTQGCFNEVVVRTTADGTKVSFSI